ncbi:MAG: pentapeptide repeat-containing protein [Chloroflexi bacterium]|nr:pentapeptide repeat-containing protein [Chloroflexota bacterium]
MSNFSRWLEEKYLKWQMETGSRSTLADFAKFLGISRVSLSQYLHDTRTPSDAHLLKIAIRFGEEVYESVQQSRIVQPISMGNMARKYFLRYWPFVLTVIITLAVFEVGQLLALSNQNNNPQSFELETPLASEMGQNLPATAEAARLQAQVTVQAIQNLKKGVCDILVPGSNLRLCDLSGRDLSNIDLSGANLQGAILDSSNLSGANLSGADLTGASMVSSTLTSANLSEAKMSGANLSGSNFAYANFINATLTGITARGADFTWVNFTGATLLGADLSDSNLLNAIMNIEQASVIYSMENTLLPMNLR